jgi:hypothetical protein
MRAIFESIDLHIDPEAVKYTQKGPWYNARLHRPDGEIIVCSTEPLLAACRELVKRGISGHIRKYRAGLLSTEGDIETFAGLTVFETERQGPRIRKYRPMPLRPVTVKAPAAVLSPEAVGQPARLSAEIGPCRHTAKRIDVGSSSNA